MNLGNRSTVFRCQAPGCKWATEPRTNMCLTHWRQVPTSIQAQLMQAYHAAPDRTSSRQGLIKSPAYVEAAQAAVDSIASKLGQPA